MPTLICDCNRTMPLKAASLGAALGEPLAQHTLLCRHEAGAFQKAIKGSEAVVVACTQEQRLFTELAQATEGAVAPIHFVNIRETGGWSRDAAKAMPKIAALLAAARLPDPEPPTKVTYRSAGRLLVIGDVAIAERAAAMLQDALQVTVFTQGGTGAQARRFPILAGRIEALTGWLGAFQLSWSASNPIDLDLCSRCNACITACPEQAIGLDWQVDLDRCTGHRACVKACDVAGAIDFSRAAVDRTEAFDLVLDLREQPAFTMHAKPQGYFHVPAFEGEAALGTVLRLRDLVGDFDKPKFFQYKQKLCAHSRNHQAGCTACIDICSAQAIASDQRKQQVVVNPNLCVGCGACTTVCPTGAMTYAAPRPNEQGARLRTLLATYTQAGGRDPTLLLHSQERGAELVEALGRAARLGRAHGVPANVIPVALWHTASTGLDLWLSAIAFGARQVAVLVTGEEAPQYLAALKAQMAVAQAIVRGLGYAGTHFELLQADSAAGVDAALQSLAGTRQEGPETAAKFAVLPEKRATLDFAIDHLVALAPAKPDAITLPPQGSPFGTIAVDKDRCTLCMSCVGACPAGALQDNPELPQLRFIEKNCVQCGLCATTCPESAITLQPRLLLTPERRQARVLNQTQPFGCVRCGKPFGTLKGIEAMLGKLASHSMYQGAAFERLKMCGDCRVIDIHTSKDALKIHDL
jgi:ferredoxin